MVDIADKKCLYGVSVGSPWKRLNLVGSGFGWVWEHFPHCAILIGDSLYRISLQITRGLNPVNAAVVSAQETNDMLSELKGHFGKHSLVIRTSEVMEQVRFAGALQLITTLHEENTLLRNSIIGDAAKFVDRQRKNGRLAIEEGRAVDLAIQYLHEEIAVYLVLAEEGWLVDVYLGDELPTLKRIIKGVIPGAPHALTQRINVALRPAQSQVRSC